MNVADSVVALIGNTPMVRINHLTTKKDASLYAKLEWCNIGGSVKDRVAKYLIEYAEAAGKLTKDKVILEATSGNTGIALAMIAAARGYSITLVMPESVSVERRMIIKAYGADLVLSPKAGGTGGAIELKREMFAEDQERYVDIDQFRDPVNVLAHYQTLGREILEQLGGTLDTVVVGIGTGGTGAGVSKRVKEHDPGIRVVGVTPALGLSIQGLRNPRENNPTQLFNPEQYDEVVELTGFEMEACIETARKAARLEGLFLGYSAGAILCIAIREARRLGNGKRVVAVLPDDGYKYLSTNLYSDEGDGASDSIL